MNDVVIEVLQSIPPMLHNPYVFDGRKPRELLKNWSEDPTGTSRRLELKTFTATTFVIPLQADE